MGGRTGIRPPHVGLAGPQERPASSLFTQGSPGQGSGPLPLPASSLCPQGKRRLLRMWAPALPTCMVMSPGLPHPHLSWEPEEGPGPALSRCPLPAHIPPKPYQPRSTDSLQLPVANPLPLGPRHPLRLALRPQAPPSLDQWMLGTHRDPQSPFPFTDALHFCSSGPSSSCPVLSLPWTSRHTFPPKLPPPEKGRNYAAVN